MSSTRWEPRSLDGLADEQISGIEAFEAFCAEREATESTLKGSREQLVESRIRLAALKRTQAALVARSRQSVSDSNEVLQVRAVVACRREWAALRLSDGLTGLGGAVIAVVEDGADVVGAAIAAQPDLVIVEELLPTVTGLDAVTQIRQFSSRTFVAAQLDNASHAQAFLRAGAHAVFSRRIHASEVVERVWDALQTAEEPFAQL